jgi:hypothetical protein
MFKKLLTEGKAVGGCTWYKYYVLMGENRKMSPVETILRMGGERIKENDGGDEFNCYILRKFVYVTMYTQHNNNMIIRKGKPVYRFSTAVFHRLNPNIT